jgi:hypothetical protein
LLDDEVMMKRKKQIKIMMFRKMGKVLSSRVFRKNRKNHLLLNKRDFLIS